MTKDDAVVEAVKAAIGCYLEEELTESDQINAANRAMLAAVEKGE